MYDPDGEGPWALMEREAREDQAAVIEEVEAGDTVEGYERVTVIIEVTNTREVDMVRTPGMSDDELFHMAHRLPPDRDSDDHWEPVEVRSR